ncbi:MAG: restriction endonuclease [Acidimicrobiia bacterium]|nr:restriction endonuclease [Acidimicrobiia bacterium]
MAEADEDESWREDLWKRLHRLTPDGFERFVRHLLRTLKMDLKRTGGVGDKGIDLIGTAPISPVLTVTVAVQAERYAPSSSVGRAEVALFQADATARGAEYGILVTTSRFTRSARETAQDRRPTITLIDGERLGDLCLGEKVGVVIRPVVDPGFFDRFE